MERMMTVKEVAEALCCSTSFVYKEISEGRLVARKRRGMKKGYVLLEKDLKAWQDGFEAVK